MSEEVRDWLWAAMMTVIALTLVSAFCIFIAWAVTRNRTNHPRVEKLTDGTCLEWAKDPDGNYHGVHIACVVEKP